VPELDVIVVPVSGGGMLSGITLAAKALKPSILVIAAEPCGSNDAADVAASKAAGQLVTDLPKPITIADGLQGEQNQQQQMTGAVLLAELIRVVRRCIYCVAAGPGNVQALLTAACASHFLAIFAHETLHSIELLQLIIMMDASSALSVSVLPSLLLQRALASTRGLLCATLWMAW
jgi:hypothetical protein